jgi:hypothetical protein
MIVVIRKLEGYDECFCICDSNVMLSFLSKYYQ